MKDDYTIQERKAIEYYYTLDGKLVEENDAIPSLYVVREKYGGCWADLADYETLDEAKKHLESYIGKETK